MRLYIFGSNKTNVSKFHSLEVVVRVSETQIQVSENFIKIIWREKG